MQQVVIDAPDEAATVALGCALAESLPDGTMVALQGTLGAGKTRLVQAIAAASGVEAGVTVSPTFVLVQEYQGTRRIVHVDAYRMRDEDEFLALGGEELFASDAIVFIEWAERIARCLPDSRLQIAIDETGASSRRFTITAIGATYEPVIGELRAWRAQRAN
jgi:tRNA threonylcarbamoyladenosine biosynthesis protein TsaE